MRLCKPELMDEVDGGIMSMWTLKDNEFDEI
jgi:hypothetical protein